MARSKPKVTATATMPSPATKFGYHAGHSASVPAQAAGEELARIEQDNGGITPAAVVNESRPAEAPLHPVFEWDDEMAAEEFRKVQASRLIRSVRVIHTEPATGERSRQVAFVSVVRQETSQREYVSTARAMSNEEFRATVLADAISQFRGMERRYGHLRELALVFRALSEVGAAG